MIQLCLLALILAFANDQIISGVNASQSFTFVNKCNYTIWPVIFSSGVSEQLSTTGFVLKQGFSNTIQAVNSWTGRFWARTQCSQDSTGKFTCLTGDCGSGKIECNGGGGGNGSIPVTLAEFTLGSNGNMDFYDVSLVDGYNLPLLVVPQGGSGASCLTTGCPVDLNAGVCPSPLKVTSAQGDDIACKTACEAFNQDVYCCNGAFSSPNTCKPSTYSTVFKKACPRAYSYVYDDQNTTFSCAGSPDYIITFCPPPATSQNPLSGSPKPSPGGDGDSNIKNNNNYFLPFVNGTTGYDGAMDVNSSGATTCIHVLRSQVIAGTVVIAIAITMWLLCQH